ncbi:unnamed protein product [Darwinula stevensoni]|uniref:Vacuolar protein sorting-associated protein 54 C-terminal domain-containing protein n=1 Tax=Darwinula stevensoni TaxID=69355 RepID=A0A7R8X7K4_9CRUS|nr:unnamed protein product [Darwinula stevensoni]CAG0887017.1 unnamed protein product [Darwinula stevensoni]
MLEADFRRYVTLDLYRPISEKELDPVDENWLQSIVFGLFRQKSAFLDVIRDEACTALEAASKEVLAEALAILPHEQELSQDEARQQRQAPSIRNLSAQALTDLLSETCQQLFLLLKRVKMLMILVAEMTALAAGREKVAVDKISSEEHGKRNALTRKSLSDILDGANLLSSEEYEKVAEGLKDVLCQSCDYAHERCARLLREMPSKLSHAEFLNIANIVQDFCQQTEELTHQKSSAMVLALQTQGAKVASRLHEEQKVNLTLLLESEQWKPTEVPAELQKLVDDIVFAGSFELNKDSSYESKPKKSLSVAGEDFTVVGVVLLLVKIMSSYSVYAKHCQFLTPDLLSRLTELLQFYNSRVCQLLLGAEARTRAGLRSITARHLALGWRSLQLIQSLIPYFQKHFLPLLASANKSNPFSQKHLDLVNRDFKAHSEQLSSKLVSILTSTFEIQLKQWEPKPPVPSNTFRSICKQLAKFHEAVEDVLPTLQVKELLLKIHEDFSQKCRWHLNRLGLASDGGPQHALVTAELTFYMQQLQGLKCMARCDSFDKFLSEVFCR